MYHAWVTNPLKLQRHTEYWPCNSLQTVNIGFLGWSYSEANHTHRELCWQPCLCNCCLGYVLNSFIFFLFFYLLIYLSFAYMHMHVAFGRSFDFLHVSSFFIFYQPEATKKLVQGLVLLNCAGGMNNKAIVDDWRIKLLSPLLQAVDFMLKQPKLASVIFERVKQRYCVSCSLCFSV